MKCVLNLDIFQFLYLQILIFSFILFFSSTQVFKSVINIFENIFDKKQYNKSEAKVSKNNHAKKFFSI
jgi:hypothetical protein